MVQYRNSTADAWQNATISIPPNYSLDAIVPILPVAVGYYRLKSVFSGKYLRANVNAPDSPVLQFTLDLAENRFVLKITEDYPEAPNFYKLLCEETNLVYALSNAPTGVSVIRTLTPPTGNIGTWMRFAFNHNNDGTMSITTHDNTGARVRADAPGQDGSGVQLYPSSDGSTNEKFVLIPCENPAAVVAVTTTPVLRTNTNSQIYREQYKIVVDVAGEPNASVQLYDGNVALGASATANAQGVAEFLRTNGPEWPITSALRAKATASGKSVSGFSTAVAVVYAPTTKARVLVEQAQINSVDVSPFRFRVAQYPVTGGTASAPIFGTATVLQDNIATQSAAESWLENYLNTNEV